MGSVLVLDSQQPGVSVFPHLLIPLRREKAKSILKRVERKECARFFCKSSAQGTDVARLVGGVLGTDAGWGCDERDQLVGVSIESDHDATRFIIEFILLTTN